MENNLEAYPEKAKCCSFRASVVVPLLSYLQQNFKPLENKNDILLLIHYFE